MKEEKKELKFFKPENVAYWDIFRNMEKCLTEAAAASALEQLFSDTIRTIVAEAIRDLPGNVWINRFNTRSQTEFFIQYSQPTIMTAVAKGNLATQTVEFKSNFVFGSQQHNAEDKLIPFLVDFFQKIGWTIKAPEVATTSFT